MVSMSKWRRHSSERDGVGEACEPFPRLWDRQWTTWESVWVRKRPVQYVWAIVRSVRRVRGAGDERGTQRSVRHVWAALTRF
jgi:hypothetical protein